MAKLDSSFLLLPPVARGSSNNRDSADRSFHTPTCHNQEYLGPYGRGKTRGKF